MDCSEIFSYNFIKNSFLNTIQNEIWWPAHCDQAIVEIRTIYCLTKKLNLYNELQKTLCVTFKSRS